MSSYFTSCAGANCRLKDVIHIYDVNKTSDTTIKIRKYDVIFTSLCYLLLGTQIKGNIC